MPCNALPQAKTVGSTGTRAIPFLPLRRAAKPFFGGLAEVQHRPRCRCRRSPAAGEEVAILKDVGVSRPAFPRSGCHHPRPFRVSVQPPHLCSDDARQRQYRIDAAIRPAREFSQRVFKPSRRVKVVEFGSGQQGALAGRLRPTRGGSRHSGRAGHDLGAVRYRDEIGLLPNRAVGARPVLRNGRPRRAGREALMRGALRGQVGVAAARTAVSLGGGAHAVAARSRA